MLRHLIKTEGNHVSHLSLLAQLSSFFDPWVGLGSAIKEFCDFCFWLQFGELGVLRSFRLLSV